MNISVVVPISQTQTLRPLNWRTPLNGLELMALVTNTTLKQVCQCFRRVTFSAVIYLQVSMTEN